MAHFAVPAHILTGKDALAEAVPYMKECGRRALIVTGKHVGKITDDVSSEKSADGSRHYLRCI